MSSAKKPGRRKDIVAEPLSDGKTKTNLPSKRHPMRSGKDEAATPKKRRLDGWHDESPIQMQQSKEAPKRDAIRLALSKEAYAEATRHVFTCTQVPLKCESPKSRPAQIPHRREGNGAPASQAYSMDVDTGSTTSEGLDTPTEQWYGSEGAAGNATQDRANGHSSAAIENGNADQYVRNVSLKPPQFSLQMICSHFVVDHDGFIMLQCLWGNGDLSWHREKNIHLTHNSAVATYWDHVEGGRPKLAQTPDFLRVLAIRGPKTNTHALIQRIGEPVSAATWVPHEEAVEKWPTCKKRIDHSLNYLSIGKQEYDPYDIDYIYSHRVVVDEEDNGRLGKKKVYRLEMNCVLSRIAEGSKPDPKRDKGNERLLMKWIPETKLHKKHNAAVLTYLNTSAEARATWEPGAPADYRLFVDEDGVQFKISQHVCRILGHREHDASTKSPKFLVQWSGYTELKRFTSWVDGKFLKKCAPKLYMQYCELHSLG